MRGYHYSDDEYLSEEDLRDLADSLALQLHELLGPRVYLLPRYDIVALIESYIDDLQPEDQTDLSWIIWHLFQEAREIELQLPE
jgi:hypothetical protein